MPDRETVKRGYPIQFGFGPPQNPLYIQSQEEVSLHGQAPEKGTRTGSMPSLMVPQGSVSSQGSIGVPTATPSKSLTSKTSNSQDDVEMMEPSHI